MRSLGWGFVALAAIVACGHAASTPPSTPSVAPVVTVSARTERFVVREHMLAAVEMQLSGEPFAEAMGRDLTHYSRDWRPPNVYFDDAPDSGPYTDLAGFSSAVESYEYSKQPMNNLAFESGAGVSLAYGPLVNPTRDSAKGCDALRAWVQRLGAEADPTGRFVHAEATAGNPLGWPGIWPAFEPYESFDPTLAVTNASSGACSITSDDDPGATGSLVSDDYECDATGLRLPDRATQIDMAITPGASGWAGWKSALWIMNYLQIMHDGSEQAVTSLTDATSSSAVGQAHNVATGADLGSGVGTYLGSSDIEGFQAGLMILGLDAAAADWLLARTTTDGATLGGFSTLSSALAYDASAPLRWWPGAIAVTESPVSGACGFPAPSTYAVRDAGSHLLDLAGMLGAYASLYALTDRANTQVGGSQPVLVYFDGDPFAADDGLPDGESTTHDRALAMMRVALVDLERMHVDPASSIPVDDVTVSSGAVSRGATLSSTTAAYTLLALRTTRRSLTDQLTLYSNTKPDTAAASTPIDAPPMASALTATSMLDREIGALAGLFYDHLTDATGRAYPTWNVTTRAVEGGDGTLDAHTAAIRGLLVAYLSTGDTRYRDRALAVFERVDATFWDGAARIYRETTDAKGDVTVTPVRFALAQAMLRDVYELIASVDGRGALATLVLDRLARWNKLVLNGWDDRNGDGQVDYPSECAFQPVAAGGPGGGLSRGGLQMGERTLTGEIGSVADTLDAGPRVVATDREPDCVPEISAAHLPSALADSITFHVAVP